MLKRTLRDVVWLHRAWRYRLFVERPEVQVVLEHLRPGDTAIDIGAHKGAFLYWMQRAVGPTGRVVAFEPQPELASYLQTIVTDWRLKHVRVINGALAHRPGVRMLMRLGESPSPGARLQLEDTSQDGIGGHVAFAVRVNTLENCLAASDRPVRLIKCDVEGHEMNVFRGARRIFEEDRPLVLFECERRHHRGASITPVFEYLEQLGYTGTFLDGHGLQPLASLPPDFQDDPHSRRYVNNFVFKPLAAAPVAERKVA